MIFSTFFEHKILLFVQKAYKILGIFQNFPIFRECLMLVLEDEKRFFSNSKRFVIFRPSSLRRYAVLWGFCNSFAMFRRDKHRDISQNPFAQQALPWWTRNICECSLFFCGDPPTFFLFYSMYIGPN